MQKTMTLNPNVNSASSFTLQGQTVTSSVKYGDLRIAFQATAGSCLFIDTVPSCHVQSIPFTVLTTLHSKQYLLKSVIPLQVQSYQGHYLVSDTITYRHGLGATLDESLLDYEEDLVAYFDSLLRNKGNISPALEHDLELLTEHIERQ